MSNDQMWTMKPGSETSMEGWEEYEPASIQGNPEYELDEQTEAILNPLLTSRGEFADWLGDRRNQMLSKKMTLVQLGMLEPKVFCDSANVLAERALNDGYDAPYFSYLEKEECIDLVLHPLAVKMKTLELVGQVPDMSQVQIEALRKWVGRGRAFMEGWLADHPEEDRNSPLWLGASFGLDQLDAAIHQTVA